MTMTMALDALSNPSKRMDSVVPGGGRLVFNAMAMSSEIMIWTLQDWLVKSAAAFL